MILIKAANQNHTEQEGILSFSKTHLNGMGNLKCYLLTTALKGPLNLIHSLIQHNCPYITVF